MITALNGVELAGILAIGANSPKNCVNIADQCKGNKMAVMANLPVGPEDMATSTSPRWELVKSLFKIISFNRNIQKLSKKNSVMTKFLECDTTATSKMIYEDYLPEALLNEKFLPSPAPLVVGKGLEYVQAAFDRQKEGVSAKKVVVSL